MRAVVILMLAVLGGVPAQPASAQSYPVRPVRLIIAVPPGGAADFTARIVGQKLADALGQQGADATFLPPGEFVAFMKAEWAKWGPVIKATGTKVD